MINAVAVAEKMYAERGLKFTDALIRCMLKGSVVSYQNEILALAEPVLWDGEHMDSEVYDRMAWNCWFCHFLYGPKLPRSVVLAMTPFYLPYTAWIRRGGQIRVYKTDRVVRGT